jgi:hypothetical protein
LLWKDGIGDSSGVLVASARWLDLLGERDGFAEVGFGQPAVSLPEAQFRADPVRLGLAEKFFGICLQRRRRPWA